MRVAVFSSKAYDRRFLGGAAQGHDLELVWLEPRLDVVTAPLAQGTEAVSVFVNDDVTPTWCSSPRSS